ncbi:hypothetical protein BEH_07620 [Priestia filamentosa]|uniref:Uncharacterized protein n=1 Tax=Priestia filamentosa TaxID=1402861 RepID=A0A0H4KUK2_9BACI|nr:hypothetical protein [Priestia filamentosa]AKO91978.1 hypothetical protein BEH_07620 [Priestia filamentosa]
MELLRFSKKAFRYYSFEIKGNEGVSYLEARKKMTRNMLLAYKSTAEGYEGDLYKYGCLWFLVKNNRIVWMRNKSYFPLGWKKDHERYEQLNEELGIKTLVHT